MKQEQKKAEKSRKEQENLPLTAPGCFSLPFTALSIRTVLKDISPINLGVVLGHDHLYTLPPPDVRDLDLWMDSEDAAIQELEDFRAAGGGLLVEMTTVDYGRDAAALARVCQASGVHVVAATGFNKGKFADRLTQNCLPEDIAKWMIQEVQHGITQFSSSQPHPEHAPHVRAGLIKASSGLDGANPNEYAVFEAAIQAHHATGAPIGTHTEKGTWALEQAALFLEGGVVPHKVLLGHLDLKPDLPYLLEVLSTGVNIGFDQFGKEKYLPDHTRVELLQTLCEQGFSSQLILGGDMARKSYFRAYNGTPGLRHIPTTIQKMLLERLPEGVVQNLLSLNAVRWLSFRVKSSEGQ
jgi:5-phospho-D-xylono-1,4-lactonase